MIVIDPLDYRLAKTRTFAHAEMYNPELGDRLGPQGRDDPGDGRVRLDVQRREVRGLHGQGTDAADEPVPGRASIATLVRAHP
ncbi:hypothetical protein RHRU231_820138 [Rhodococcus ruber]|uniref:Uncharacterized protein n=1 Tax=Rhodococcus ruber TaxID=1830 RepID=A0A098BRL2_9NOCA|nr:hypothetical protein RHRU231_820138 [Rhodococcus ruber]